MFELLLEIVLVYRLHVNTVGHFSVSFSAHVAFDMDLYTAKYSGRRYMVLGWGCFPSFLFTYSGAVELF